jgi:hypothetical protein
LELPLQNGTLQIVLGWRKDWTEDRNPSAVRSRQAYLRSLKASDIQSIANRVRDARKGRLDLANKLAWPIFDELHMVNDVSVTSNPLDLVEIADRSGADPLVVRQRFEALCLVDLAVVMHELEKHDPMDRVEYDLLSMIYLLDRRLFSPATCSLDIHTYHDPEDSHRVKEVSYDTGASFPGLLERKHNSTCRVTNENVVVRSDARPKDRFETVLKLLRQTSASKSGRDPFVVMDRCAMKFAVKDISSARRLAEDLTWQLIAANAEVRDGGDNLTVETNAPADTSNARSSSKYRKKQLDVLWHGRWYEFQIVIFPHYYSALYALDEENHDIYKLRQGYKDVLPMLFPGPIYLEEKTWDSESLQRLLHERQMQHLGWHLRSRNGKH